MEREPYWRRAGRRIWQETYSSAKKRTPPLVISVMSLGLGYFYGVSQLHVGTKEAIKVGLICGLGANLIWLFGVLIYNVVRVPWLLDAESGALINAQESRAQTAEKTIQERKRQK